MRVIVGLGNPGQQYRGTRHNVGFDVVDTLSRRHGIRLRSRRCKAQVGEGAISEERVVLVKPLTFVNLSGEAVADLARRRRLEAPDVVVVCDDANLPLGRLRIRARGSAGGHHGLESIIDQLGSEDFVRIRVGIGMPEANMVDYVLSRFSGPERDIAREATVRAADAVDCILALGVDEAMNRYNRPPTTP